jgi:8-amino-7-oxononanoate synthase
LESRRKSGRLRELNSVESEQEAHIVVDGKRYINLSSNDYLGLTSHPEVVSCTKYYLDKYGSGSGASRLITGSREYHKQLESELSNWLGVESTLLFNSGYQLNSTLLSALADRDSIIYSDRLNHNSIVQGIIASRAVHRRYKHLDYAHLELLLRKDDQKTRKIIITESVFSMDGDVADIVSIAALAEEFDAILVVDEAHAVGVMGHEGKGIGHGIDRIDLRIGTFGKAFGSFGAYVAGSSELINYLINFCGGFIYTTALPPAVIGATQCALDLIKTMDAERQKLQELSYWFRSQLSVRSLHTFGSTSHIVPVFIGDEFKTLELSDTLKSHGFWVNAIRPPTVESGTSRLRFTLNVHHTMVDLSGCIEIIQKSVSSEP